MIIGDTEATDELIDKHASIMRIMENKKKTVEEFIVKGEKLMEDPKSPKFLETHVSKLKEWPSGVEGISCPIDNARGPELSNCSAPCRPS